MFGDRIVVPGLGDITDDVNEELLNIIQQDEVRMEMERRAIAASHRGREERIGADGTRVTMRVPARAYHYWRLREGADVWNDTFHRDYMRKHHPELFPKHTTGRTVVTVPASGVFGKRGRWARPT